MNNRMRHLGVFLFWKRPALIMVLWAHIVQAAPLGAVPAIEETDSKFIFTNSSDLWTSPYRSKPSPVRIYDTELRIPFVTKSFWTGFLSAKAGGISIGRSDVTLGNDQVFIGTDFRSQSLGVGLTRDLPAESSFTFFVNYISASDEVWRKDRDEWVEGVMVYRAPAGATYRWIAMVDYTRNRGFLNDKPFAYLGLIQEASPTLTVTYGFPFLRMNWIGKNDWITTLTLTPALARAEVAKDLFGPYQVHALAADETRSYLHANRIQNEKRIFFEERRIEAGFTADLSIETSLTFDLGWSFDRFIYEGENVFATQGSGYRLNGDLYGTISLEFRR